MKHGCNCACMAGLGRYRGKHEITQSGGQTIEGRRIVLHVLFADSQQIKQFHDRRDAFQSQQQSAAQSAGTCPSADTHHISLERSVVMALVCFAAIVVMYWPVFRSIFSGGSLYSDVLLSTVPASLNWCSPPPRHGCLAAAPAFLRRPRRGCWC